MLQTSVEMVKPAGTGKPALVISARFAPLPPSVSRIVRSPSAFPPPKKYTCFPTPLAAAFRGVTDLTVFAAAFTAFAAVRRIAFATRATVRAGFLTALGCRRVAFVATFFAINLPLPI